MKITDFLVIIVVLVGGYFLYTSGKLDKPIEMVQQLPSNITGDSSKQKANDPTPSKVNDFGPVGSLNHELLQGQNFEKLIVEIDYEANSQPKNGGVLLQRLKKYADKPGGIIVSGANSFQKTKDSYSLSDIQALVRSNRSSYTSGKTATIYVLYLNGTYASNQNALGLAINATTMVIFPDQIDRATTALVFGSTIESAILTHELGHLLGLVNLTYKSNINHEDPAHSGHSSNPNSVMYWAVEDISISSILSGGPPTQFDSSDEKDIQNIKAGVY